MHLTDKGREEIIKLDTDSGNDLSAQLNQLITKTDQKRLILAMTAIKQILGNLSNPKESYLLRPPDPGDRSWIIYQHGRLYAGEYGWNEQFEALSAEVIAEFVHHNDPKKERCWIADSNGENVGSIPLDERV